MMQPTSTPPQEPDADHQVEASAHPTAVLHILPLETLRNRPDFLRAASARRKGTAGFLLQARDRGDDLPARRIGFTASKKIGNAVLRNRAKRRLRALAQAILPDLAQPGWDYVLVARPGATVSRLFSDLQADLSTALSAIHRAK